MSKNANACLLGLLSLTLNSVDIVGEQFADAQTTEASVSVSDLQAVTGQRISAAKKRTEVRIDKEPVKSLTLFPDGVRAATGGSNREIAIWDIKTGKRLQTWKGHDDWVFSISFSEDSRIAVSGSRDKTAMVWDVRENTAVAVLRDHTDEVFSVRLTADGTTLYSASRDGTIHARDLATAESYAHVSAHDQARALALSPDESLLASSGYDGLVKIWKTPNLEPVVTLKGHKRQTKCLAYSTNGKWLASGSADGQIFVWDLEQQEVFRTWKAHSNEVRGLQFTAHDKQLASSSYDGKLKIWNLATTETSVEVDHAALAVGVTLDLSSMLSANVDGTVTFWDLETETH